MSNKERWTVETEIRCYSMFDTLPAWAQWFLILAAVCLNVALLVMGYMEVSK